MSSILEELGISQMTIEQRIALAQEILDSVLAEQPKATLSESKRLELQRRLAEHAANPHDVVPWEQIEAQAASRFGK
jgi:putative addiction module component (TIGR02574 family)